MKNVSFGVGKMLKSEELNARFGDLAGGSILSGFRLAPGSSNYLISLVRDAAPTMKVLLPDGTRLEETGDALDVVAVRPNLASANRIDVLYVTYNHERNKDFSYELVEGVAGLPLDVTESDRKLALGYITVRPRQAVIATDLTSFPIGLKKIGRFGETVKQVLFTTTENQTVINLEHDFLVGQNRITLTIGGVKQFFGKDYDETSTRQLTMKEPLPGGLACEVLVSTSTRVYAEDFKKETDAAKQATLDAVNAAKAANDAKATAYTEMKTPVANLAAIGSTYPTAVDGTEVQTLDDGKIYRKEKGVWVYRKELTPGPYTGLDSKFAELAKKIDTKTFYLISNGIDDTGQVQSAFDAMTEGDTLYIKGKLLIKNDLVMSNKKKITLKGDSSKTSFFFNSSIGKTIKFSNVSNLMVEGVGFYGNGDPYTFGSGATNGDGIELTNCTHWNLNDCEFSYCGGNGINFVTGCWVFNFINVRIVGNQLNGVYASVKTSLQATALNFINPLIFSNKQSGILWASTGLSILGGVVENNDIGINFDCVVANSGVAGVSISGVDFELNKNGHIKGKTSNSYSITGVDITGCHFTDNGTALKPFIWFEGSLIVQSIRIGKNAYTGINAVNILDFNNLAIGTCDIEISRGNETKFVNLGSAKVNGFLKKIAISGLLDQKGIPFTKLDKSDNLLSLNSIEGFWKLPVVSQGKINGLDIYVETDATTDYSVLFSLFRLNEAGTLVASFTASATKTGGGNGKLSFSSIGLIIPFTSNDSLFVKTTFTKPTTGTNFYVKNLTFLGE